VKKIKKSKSIFINDLTSGEQRLCDAAYIAECQNKEKLSFIADVIDFYSYIN
jgi:hypothetical protein